MLDPKYQEVLLWMRMGLPLEQRTSGGWVTVLPEAAYGYWQKQFERGINPYVDIEFRVARGNQ